MNSARMLRRAIVAGKPKTNHTVLTYLESTGTQYINTGVIGTSEISVEFSAAGTVGGVFGEKVDNTQKSFCYGASGKMYARYNNASVAVSTYLDIYTFYKYKMIKNLSYVNDVLITTFTYTYFTSTLPMYLFAYNNNGALSIGSWKIKYCKIWDASNNLIQHLIPVLKSDGTYCMYDDVTGTYFYNQGTGTFTGG